MTELWSYLSNTPLFWLVLTVATFLLASEASRRSGNHPLCNPVLLTALILIGLLQSAGVTYATYFAGAQFIHFLLGPATVALAVPLFRSVVHLRGLAIPLLAGLAAGTLASIGSTGLLGHLMGLDETTIRSMLPRSVTTPIAIGISERIGGVPSLTAALVIMTGIIGAVIGDSLLRLLRIEAPPARGFAIGLAAHGIGTARALQQHAAAGAFAGLAMSLNGLATAIILPLLL